MIKSILGKTGMEISKVFYGGIVSMQEGQDNSDKYVAYAIEKGINYFDIAPSYGDAQEKLGNSLVPYRKDIFLACKTTSRDAEGAKSEIEKSLEMLHTDYLDNYQLHSITTVEEVDAVFAKGGAFEPIFRMKEQGVFKHLGITCHSEQAALRALEHYDFETILFPINWGLIQAKGFGNSVIEKCNEKGVGILGMKSMIYSAWESDEEKKNSIYPKSWCKPIPADEVEFRIAAMKFAYDKGAVSLVPPGNFECFSFAVENIDKITKPLSEDERKVLIDELPKIEGKHFF